MDIYMWASLATDTVTRVVIVSLLLCLYGALDLGNPISVVIDTYIIQLVKICVKQQSVLWKKFLRVCQRYARYLLHKLLSRCVGVPV